MNRTSKVVREIIYDHKSNAITLYAHGPSGFKRPLSAQEIVKTIQCYPADATIEIDTITNADDIELGNDVRNAIKGVLGIHSPSKYLSDAANINRNCDPCDYDLVYAIDTLIGYFAATGIYDIDVYKRNTEAVKKMTIEDIEKELGYRIDIIKSQTSKKIKTDNRKEI